ncbi:MAG: Uma2 family endonuclease [Myxococcota bacterium]|nr:Uma2 family endonuclease [Myxococcota bacterium]MDW8362458.1 Uma2 family endonuclease [Myxococcales bacterium]
MVLPAPVKTTASYDDLRALPPHLVGQIIDGELYALPRPATAHALAASALASDLFDAFHRGRRGPGGWIVLVEPELHLDRDVLVPDLAAWRRTRMPTLPEAPALELAPDWCCEVLSPSTRALDRVLKLRVYARHRVPHLWYVDPEARSVEVLRLEGAHYALVAAHVDDERVSAEPFNAVELELAPLWAR